MTPVRCYMVVTAIIHDREKFLADYGVPAGELVAEYGGRYVLRAPGVQALEGDFGDGGSMVISEWPDRAAALAFWNSDAYAAIRSKRGGISVAQVLLIDAPAFTAPT